MEKIEKAIFLDKDGTLIPDIPYNVDPDLITLSVEAINGLKRLVAAGFRLILISNQSGVAFSYFHEHALLFVERKINRLLQSEGLYLSDFYYCPHHPKGVIKTYRLHCLCRKPNAGLFFRAAKDHHIVLSKSWMIGDILNDVEAGNRAGCRTLLIDNGNETEWKMNDIRTPDGIVTSINTAADFILEL